MLGRTKKFIRFLFNMAVVTKLFLLVSEKGEEPYWHKVDVLHLHINEHCPKQTSVLFLFYICNQ